jgi:hypothetical protein
MIRIAELRLPLAQADAPQAPLAAAAAHRLGLPEGAIARLAVFKRSFDARKAELLAVYIVDVELADPGAAAALLTRLAHDPHVQPTPDMAWRPPVAPRRPAGRASGRWWWASAPAASSPPWCWRRLGLKPIVLERGKPVRERTQDTWGLWRRGQLDPESNVQFGEGGAGLFSDGKLYSQVRDPRHLGRKVMAEFVPGRRAGGNPLGRAPARRHLQAGEGGGEPARADHRPGRRDPLPAPRDRSATGTGAGGAVPARAEGRKPSERRTRELPPRHVVLALGHSARDTFAVLHARGVAMVAKPFSIGVRIEHPQGRDRPRALGPPRRPPAAGRGRLQAGAPRQRTGARSTASACAPAAPWWPPPASPAAWSPTA